MVVLEQIPGQRARRLPAQVSGLVDHVLHLEPPDCLLQALVPATGAVAERGAEEPFTVQAPFQHGDGAAARARAAGGRLIEHGPAVAG